MEFESLAVVVLLAVIALTSVFLINFITKFIRLKPTLKLTLVDLLYCDILRFLGLQMLVFVSAIIGCHLSERYL